MLVVGSVLPDLHFALPNLPESGGDVLAQRFELRLGGSAWLVATALRELGVDCAVVMRRGRGPLDRLIEERMRLAGIPAVGRAASGECGVTVTLVEPSGERSLVSAFGVEAQLGAEDLAAAGADASRIVYASGYETTHSPTLDARIGTLPRTVTFVFDPGPRGSAPGRSPHAWRRADLVRLNLQEAEAVTGRRGRDAVRAVGEIATAVVSTREGAYLAERGRVREFPSGPAATADTTGAGDAHTAGLIAGILRGLQLDAAVRLANASARRRVLTGIGAGF